jgi:peptidoglycan/xylan/chitin deacetylase (PgdA/CDA1 family)
MRAMTVPRRLSTALILFLALSALPAQSWLPVPPVIRLHPFEAVRGLYYFTDRGNYRLAAAGGGPVFSEDIDDGLAVDFGDRLAFTFDDVRFGPSLDRLLDLLGERGVRAVFFLSENHMASTDRATIRRQLERMIAEGHELGNHGAGHNDFDAPHFRSRPEAVGADLERLEAVVDGLLGRHYPMRWIRPPFGVRGNGGRGTGVRMSLPGAVDDWCLAQGRNIILWHINSLDFLLFEPAGSKDRLTVPQVVAACLKRISVSRGGAVLFHANGLTPAVVRGVLDGLATTPAGTKLRDWCFVTVADLLKIKYGGTGQ